MNEPGVTREYKRVADVAYARVREGWTGEELWRSRWLHGRQIDMHACAFGTIDEFIDWVRNEQN